MMASNAVSGQARSGQGRAIKGAPSPDGKSQRLRNSALTWDVPLALGEPPAPANGIASENSGTWVAGDTLRNQPVVSPQRTAFDRVSVAHLQTVVHRLLDAESPEVRDKWMGKITCLALESAMSLSPSALVEHGVCDPRFYVKVKCLPYDSLAGESCVVQGLVCRKNVAHRRMRTSIEQPRVLMLRGSLESNRGSSTSLSSFESVIDKEEENLKAAVEQLATLKPDVILVERSVGRCAQGLLLEKGIALVLNVKGSLLNRLSRCTGAKVADSVKDLSAKCVASCKEFGIKPLMGGQGQLGVRTDSSSALPQLTVPLSEGNTFADRATPAGSSALEGHPQAASAAPTVAAGNAAGWKAPLTAQGAKTLMFFRGTPLHTGCTILLKGESREQLMRLKAVTNFAVFAAYRLRLESAFLSDQSAAASCASGWLMSHHPLLTARTPRSLVTGEDAISATWRPQVDEERTPRSPTGSAQAEPSVELSGDESTTAALAGKAGLIANGVAPVWKAGSSDTVAADAMAAVQRSADLTAEDVKCKRAYLSLSPHFALWPAPSAPSVSSTPATQQGAEQPAVKASSNTDTSNASSNPLAAGTSAEVAPDISSSGLQSSPHKQLLQPTLLATVARMQDEQRLVFSTASRNPTKKLLCEGPQLRTTRPYDAQDNTFKAFLMSSIPANDRKCAVAACGAGFTHHLRTFLQGSQRLTLSVAQLPASCELPGGPSGHLWMWSRPLPTGEAVVAGVRRLRMSPEAECLSFGHFLQLSFGVQHLESHGWHVHNEWVRYVGCGAAVACFHVEGIVPNVVALPPPTIAYIPRLQQEWLRQELHELAKEAQRAFSAVEFALQQHQPCSPQHGGALILQSLLNGLADEQQVYNNDLMDIATLLRLNSTVAPAGAEVSSGEGENEGAQTAESAVGSNAGEVPAPVRDHILVAIVWELNRLRRSLMLTVLAWSASLHDPVTYTRSYTTELDKSKTGISAFIANTAAAEGASGGSTIRSNNGVWTSTTQLAPPQPVEHLSPLLPPPTSPLPSEPHATPEVPDTATRSLPESNLTVRPSVSRRFDSSQAPVVVESEGSDATAYAATALADTLSPAADAQYDSVKGPSRANNAVDWKLVGSRAQGSSPSPSANPLGTVARLRAIYEQSSHLKEENPALQRQRTIEWLTAADADRDSNSSGLTANGVASLGSRSGRRRSADSLRLPSQAVGPWGPVVKLRRPSNIGGRAYPYLSTSRQSMSTACESSSTDDNALQRALSAEEVNLALHEARLSEEALHMGSESDDSDSDTRGASGSVHTPLSVHRPRGSSVTLDLVIQTCSKCNDRHCTSGLKPPQSETGHGMARSTSAAELSHQASVNSGDGNCGAASAGDDDSPGEGTGLLSILTGSRSHRRTISEPSTPDTPAGGNSMHRDVHGSGELPHFEEWATFVNGAVSPVKADCSSQGGTRGPPDEDDVSARPAAKGSAQELCGSGGSLQDGTPSAPATPVAPTKAPEGMSKRPPLPGIPSMKKLSLRRHPHVTSAAAGTIPLATSGRVELGGRALLPPGIDDLVLSIFDDEPTSIVAYFLANRTYQQYMEDSLEGILHGGRHGTALPPAAREGMKRAFSTTSDTCNMDAAANAAASDVAAQASSIQAAVPQSMAAPLKSGIANLCPAPTSVRGLEKSAKPSNAVTDLPPAIPAAKPLAKATLSTAHVLHEHLAAVATAGSNGGQKEAPLPDLPPTAVIASELYGLHLTDNDAPSTPPFDHQQPKGQLKAAADGTASTAVVADSRIVEVAGKAATAAAVTLPGAENDAPKRASESPDATSSTVADATCPGKAVGKHPSLRPIIARVDYGSAHPVAAGSLTCPSEGSSDDNSAHATQLPEGGSIPAAGVQAVGERVLLCEDRLDFKCTVEESPGMPWPRAKFEVVAYFALQFAEVRRQWVAGGEAAFVASLSRCRKWDSSGGKSNAYFAKTRDERFIVKQLSRSEKGSLLNTAPAYFAYLSRRHERTCLAKILGVYQVTQKNIGTGSGGDSAKGAGRDGIMDLLVMENIFYGRNTTRIYDLKGSERSRLTAEEGERSGAVLMDENLRRSNLSSPILIDPVAYAMLEEALWADTAFLSALGVMDYSLLVGVDRDKGVLVVGVIDFVRQFTWDKQLETWVKSTGILAGGKEPTVISPKQYCRRFRVAMASYFTVVPALERPQPPRSPDA